MASKLIVLSFLALIFLFASKTSATTYTVGDNSGWDISTNLDSWTTDKNFNVGDALLFQYSSSDSVCEVTRQNFQTCNTTNVLHRYTDGNTTIPLTQPGSRYFISGNQLYCMGGMKLQVNTLGDATSPAGAPAASFPAPDSKNGPVINSGGGIVLGGWKSFVVALIGLMSTVLCFV